MKVTADKMSNSSKVIVGGCGGARKANNGMNDIPVELFLAYDPFHEVKSRKEKKKETRDMPDSRPRGANNIYNRGGRGGSDRYAGRSASTHLSSTDSGNYQGKSTNKKESGTQGYTSSMNSQAPRLL
ncbi:hypothetical protein Bca52824_001254 [Brassica carinata]|uniref:Uncharacterized protein n=1 Tax=Brassica carinata TaxID=52824 RepID=A0A8X7WFX9_BRACI|nr:hypothetical protein Bca52824_001254 [Brassica carinata]